MMHRICLFTSSGEYILEVTRAHAAPKAAKLTAKLNAALAELYARGMLRQSITADHAEEEEEEEI